MRKYVNGEPVFCLFPIHAYLAGGSYRVLPNDSLRKVADYGKKTGVRWILIDRTKYIGNELRYYTEAGWYGIDSLGIRFPDVVRLRIETPDRAMALYEIK